jgi:hypothetical protein
VSNIDFREGKQAGKSDEISAKKEESTECKGKGVVLSDHAMVRTKIN